MSSEEKVDSEYLNRIFETFWKAVLNIEQQRRGLLQIISNLSQENKEKLFQNIINRWARRLKGVDFFLPNMPGLTNIPWSSENVAQLRDIVLIFLDAGLSAEYLWNYKFTTKVTKWLRDRYSESYRPWGKTPIFLVRQFIEEWKQTHPESKIASTEEEKDENDNIDIITENLDTYVQFKYIDQKKILAKIRKLSTRDKNILSTMLMVRTVFRAVSIRSMLNMTPFSSETIVLAFKYLVNAGASVKYILNPKIKEFSRYMDYGYEQDSKSAPAFLENYRNKILPFVESAFLEQQEIEETLTLGTIPRKSSEEEPIHIPRDVAKYVISRMTFSRSPVRRKNLVKEVLLLEKNQDKFLYNSQSVIISS